MHGILLRIFAGNFFSRASRKQFHVLLLHIFWFSKGKEALQKVARHTLVVLLKPIVRNYLNRKKFHQICLEEMPWRSQMNIYLAFAHYNLFKKKLEERYNIGICGSQHLDRYIFLLYQWLLLMQTDLNYNIISQVAA